MQEAQNLPEQEKENLAAEVSESLGMNENAEEKSSVDSEENNNELPVYAKEKIGKLQKRYNRDIRRLQDQVNELRSSQNNYSPPQNFEPPVNNNDSENNPGNVQDYIHKAVNYALQHKELEERKIKDAERQAFVHKQYERLNDHLDRASERYEDFDEVVRSNDAPFSEAIRDAALLIHNPGDVLYKLGKNREELSRISKLHPLEQAREVNKLSFALMNGNEKSSSSSPNEINTLGNIKSTPVVNSRSINEKTSISDLRKKMKSGWK